MSDLINNSLFKCQHCGVVHDGEVVELDSNSSFNCMKCQKVNFIGQCPICGDFLITGDLKYKMCDDCNKEAIFNPNEFQDPAIFNAVDSENTYGEKLMDKFDDFLDFIEDSLPRDEVIAVLGAVSIVLFLLWFVFFPHGIEGKLKDAIAPLQLISYNGPYEGRYVIPLGGGKGFSTDLSSGCSKIESYSVYVTGSNAFGGTVGATYIVFFNDGDVCGTYSIEGGTYVIADKVKRDCGCG